MTDDILTKLAKLDEAEALLNCTSVRGIANGFRTQMDLNRMILQGARSALDQREAEAKAADDGKK